jgi:hypothetical protein
VDGYEDALQFGNFQNSGRIGTQLQGKPIACFTIGEDPRQPGVYGDVRR